MGDEEVGVEIEVDDRVCGGEPGSEDYDEGTVIEVDGDWAWVAWSNGERTRHPLSDLRLLSPGVIWC